MTVVPLVQRTATALSNWLQPAFDPLPVSELVSGLQPDTASPPAPLELRPDLDQLEALSHQECNSDPPMMQIPLAVQKMFGFLHQDIFLFETTLDGIVNAGMRHLSPSELAEVKTFLTVLLDGTSVRNPLSDDFRRPLRGKA